MGRSLFDKVWDQHVVETLPGGNVLLFIDKVVAHEITTPQGAIEILERFGDRGGDRFATRPLRGLHGVRLRGLGDRPDETHALSVEQAAGDDRVGMTMSCEPLHFAASPAVTLNPGSLRSRQAMSNCSGFEASRIVAG